jgi:hypothetical protein
VTSRRRASNILRYVLWGALGLWAVGLGAFALTRQVRAAPRPGERMPEAGTTVHSTDGGSLPLLPHDSVVVLLAATSECAVCRTGIPAYREMSDRLTREGVAFRVIVGSELPVARQYSRLLPDPGTVVADPGQKLFRSMGVRVVPSLYLVGRGGLLRRAWAPLTAGPGVVDSIVSEARRAR